MNRAQPWPMIPEEILHYLDIERFLILAELEAAKRAVLRQGMGSIIGSCTNIGKRIFGKDVERGQKSIPG